MTRTGSSALDATAARYALMRRAEREYSVTTERVHRRLAAVAADVTGYP